VYHHFLKFKKKNSSSQIYYFSKVKSSSSGSSIYTLGICNDGSSNSNNDQRSLSSPIKNYLLSRYYKVDASSITTTLEELLLSYDNR
jgi:hypothetical protein